ncbi:MAG: hypothetical protein J5725_04355 [Bacteroidales bacterium]|nr:hypothetical protein [Bacteroidales bacterium]
MAYKFYLDRFTDEYIKAEDRDPIAPPERYVPVENPEISIAIMEQNIQSLRSSINILKDNKDSPKEQAINYIHQYLMDGRLVNEQIPRSFNLDEKWLAGDLAVKAIEDIYTIKELVSSKKEAFSVLRAIDSIVGEYKEDSSDVDKGMCADCEYKTDSCQEGLHCPKENE